MPSYFPELDVPYASDSEWRSLQKWASLLWDANGPVSLPIFPEGAQPLASDDEERLLKKINALRS